METGANKKQPPKSGGRPKTSARTKQRSSIPAPSSSSKSMEESREKKSPRKPTYGRKPTYAELFAPVPASSCSSSSFSKLQKNDVRIFDPVNINAFVKKMEEKKEMVLKGKFVEPDSTDDFPDVSVSSQPGPSGSSSSTSRGNDGKKKFGPLGPEEVATGELAHGYDSSGEGAVGYADAYKKGDIPTSSVLDSMQEMDLGSPSGQKDMEKKPAPMPKASSGDETSELRTLVARHKGMEEVVQNFDSFIADAVNHADVFRSRGDFFTAAVLDSIKAKELSSPSKRQPKKKE